jgi:hypothetical protein
VETGGGEHHVGGGGPTSQRDTADYSAASCAAPPHAPTPLAGGSQLTPALVAQEILEPSATAGSGVSW